ncbi:MAG: hypothetical protein GQ540_03620 [Lutibacter sp.]|uniref:hypothetical protein n=1 Tax=Lutibacter sp. TaxID=1925666 RepID=UPI001A088D83|nr:hypothetical protein [Lutibacter sp.]NOR27601.1 hypothetical protein [Lutibacter sp.]
MAKAVWFDKDIDSKIDKASKRIIKAGCIALSNDLKDMMGGSNAGQHLPYRSKKNPTQTHWSSKPGSAPNIDTGALKDSISWDTSFGASGGARRGLNEGVKSPGGGRFVKTGAVGTNHPGAKALEFGYSPNNLAPRPFMTVAYEFFKLNDFLRKFRL